jgi:hypothetical protein
MGAKKIIIGSSVPLPCIACYRARPGAYRAIPVPTVQSPCLPCKHGTVGTAVPRLFTCARKSGMSLPIERFTPSLKMETEQISDMGCLLELFKPFRNPTLVCLAFVIILMNPKCHHVGCVAGHYGTLCLYARYRVW